METTLSHLRKLKQKFNEDGFQKYFKNTSWLLMSRILSMVISFITTAFIARNLGPTNYGQLSYATSFVAIFSFIASLGLDNILYRDLLKNRDRGAEILGSALAIKLLASLLTAILIITSAIIFTTDDVSKILIFILAFTFTFNAFTVVNNEFQIRVLSKYSSIITIAVTLILNILKVIVIALHKGVIYLAVILFLETVLYASFYLFAYKKVLGGSILKWKFNTTIALGLLRDSLPLIFSYAFAIIYARVDQVLIKHMIDARAVGIYDSAVRIAEVWYFVPGIIISSLTPAIVNANMVSEQSYNARLKKLIYFMVFVTIFVGITVTIFAPFIMNVIYGNEFMEGVKILQIYVWSGLPVALGTLSVIFLIVEKNGKYVFYSTFIPMVTNIILNILWIPTYGIVGSAYATLISYSLGPLSLLLFTETRSKIIKIFTHSSSRNTYEK